MTCFSVAEVVRTLVADSIVTHIQSAEPLQVSLFSVGDVARTHCADLISTCVQGTQI